MSNNAFERGPVTAAQPALTIIDPLVSIAIGVALFGESLRTGPFIALWIAGLVLLTGGVFLLARSPMATGEADTGSALQGHRVEGS